MDFTKKSHTLTHKTKNDSGEQSTAIRSIIILLSIAGGYLFDLPHGVRQVLSVEVQSVCLRVRTDETGQLFFACGKLNWLQ